MSKVHIMMFFATPCVNLGKNYGHEYGIDDDATASTGIFCAVRVNIIMTESREIYKSGKSVSFGLRISF